MKFLTIQLPDSKFGEKLKPNEDSFFIDKNENIFCVADGITRDPIGVKDFSSKPVEEIFKKYPNPSPAKIAANLFSETFGSILSKLKPEEINQKSTKEAFLKGNEKIRKLNQKENPNPNFLENDFWACVACGGKVQNNKLFWSGIGDCGLVVFDKNQKKKFQTPNWVEPFANYQKNIKFDWSKPEGRKLIRSKYRNNPNQIANGSLVSYGALTGEKEADFFVQSGEIVLKKAI